MNSMLLPIWKWKYSMYLLPISELLKRRMPIENCKVLYKCYYKFHLLAKCSLDNKRQCNGSEKSMFCLKIQLKYAQIKQLFNCIRLCIWVKCREVSPVPYYYDLHFIAEDTEFQAALDCIFPCMGLVDLFLYLMGLPRILPFQFILLLYYILKKVWDLDWQRREMVILKRIQIKTQSQE